MGLSSNGYQAVDVVAVDDEFCRHRYVSLVRDNGKKFYITRAEEVNADFNIHQWDT